MLHVTPIYGSRYNIYGESEEPTCTLIEFSNCRCIFNVGYNGSYWNRILTVSQGIVDNSVNSKVLVDNDQQQQQQQKENEVLKFPDHDCVFIMNSTWQCVSGLPIYYDYMIQQYNAGIITSVPPIYTTYPTIKMGLMTLYDYHASIAMDGLNPPFTLASIDNVFTSMNAIKFNQHIYVTPQSNLLLEQSTTTTTTTTSSTGTTGTITSPQLSVTAHRAGYVVGAAYFVIQRLMDETTVIYTDSTYHMSKELHLEACTLLSQSSITSLPDIFITRPGGPSFRQFRALVTNQQNNMNTSSGTTATTTKNQPKQLAAAAILQQPLVQQAERNLIENIMSVLRRDGNVLLPVDTSGRILEIALLLHLEWDKQKFYNTYNLICYSQMCYNVFDYAKSQLEWMSQQLNAQFADHGQHPFRFGSNRNNKAMDRTIQFCTSIHELNTILMDNQNPSCIIASGLSLEGGPSRDVLLKFADNPDNAIFFTDSSQCYLRRTYYNNNNNNNNNYTNNAKVSDNRRTTNNNSTGSYTHHGNMSPSTSVPNNERLDSDGIITLTDDNITMTTDIISPTAPSLLGTSIDNANNEDDVDDDVTNIGEALTGDNKSIWTTAGQLLQAWATAKALGTEMADVVVVDVNVPIRAPLSGNELKIFLEQEEQKRQAYIKAAEKRAMLAQVELAKGQLRLSEDDNVPSTTTTSSSSSSGLTKDAQQVTSTMKTKSTRPKKKSRFDSTLFLKFSKPLYSTCCICNLSI